MKRAQRVELIALPGFPMVAAGDDLADAISRCARACGHVFESGDVVVVAQKIVSKAEGRIVALDDVHPSANALALASQTGKDARLVEIILSESEQVVRAAPNVLIVRHRLGYVMANAGVDQSNVAPNDGTERALLLPVCPDSSARALRAALEGLHHASIAVIINDSFGRPWRRGVVGIALGAAGLEALSDQRGRPDLYGRTLQATTVATADEIAAAASLLMGQADEGLPVVVVRGLRWKTSATSAIRDVIRPAHEDLFR